MSIVDPFRYVSGVPVFSAIVFKSKSNLSPTFSIRHVGLDDPIWKDNLGNIFQPAKVGDVSTVTFPWVATDEKTVNILVENPADVRGLSETEFINKDLTLVDLSACVTYRDSIELYNNSLLTTFIAPVSSGRLDSGNNIHIYNCNITGTLDLSTMPGLTRGNIRVEENLNMTAFIEPINFDNIQVFNIDETGISSLDLTKLVLNAAGTRRTAMGDCPNLTSITWPANNQPLNINSFNFTNQNSFAALAGLIDFSKWVGGIREMYCNYGATTTNVNDNVTEIRLPPSSNLQHNYGNFNNADFNPAFPMLFTGRQLTVRNMLRITNLPITDNAPTTSVAASSSNIVNNPNLTGVLNLRWYKGRGGLRVTACPLVTGLILPVGNSGSFGDWAFMDFSGFYIDFSVWPNCLKTENRDFSFKDNTMSTAVVNHILVDLAAIALLETPGGDFVNRRILCDGTNAAPDGGSGGFNGLQAISDLNSRGIIVVSN